MERKQNRSRSPRIRDLCALASTVFYRVHRANGISKTRRVSYFQAMQVLVDAAAWGLTSALRRVAS